MRVEQQKCTELDSQLSKSELRIKKDALRLTKMEQKNASLNLRIDHKIATYENRLHKQKLDYNKILASNGKMRQKLQHLRGEQQKFEANLAHLKNVLENRRRVQANMIDEGNNAFDMQEDAIVKKSVLFERNDKDHIHHSIEYRELLRTLDNDESVRTFMDEKLNERGELALAAVTTRREKAAEKYTGEVQAKMIQYEDAFGTIYASYGEKTPEELLKMLRTKETDNFTVYQCRLSLAYFQFNHLFSHHRAKPKNRALSRSKSQIQRTHRTCRVKAAQCRDQLRLGSFWL